MPAPGALSVGIPIVVTTGSAQQVVPRGGQMLGFYSSASQAFTVYDSSSTTVLPTAKLTATACQIGWNPLPIEFTNGLVINCATQFTAVIL